MLSSYRRQVFITLILFVISLFLITSFITIRMVESHQITTIREALLREAETIRLLLAPPSQDAIVIMANIVSVVEDLKKSTEARVTIIDQNGKVLADSNATSKLMDNHLQRPEIQEADEKTYGSSIRTSITTDVKTLYVAIPVYSGNQTIGYLRLANSLAEVESMISTIIRYLVGTMILLFILSAFISWRIARSLSKPVLELRAVAEQITDGNYSSRVTYQRKNEIGQLGQSINEMADSLQVQMQRLMESENRLKNVLDHLHVGVVLTNYDGEIVLYNPFLERFDPTDQMPKSFHGMKLNALQFPLEFIQEWHNALDQRTERTCELRTYYPDERMIDVQFVPIWSGMVITFHDLTSIRRLEKMRSEFVANVSHELRTPLAAIRGFAETLKLGALHDAEAADSFIQIIMDESDRLNRLVNDLLDLSRMETRRTPLFYESITIAHFIKELAELLNQEINKKALSIKISGDETVILEADRDRLRQIMLNLLHNAIQYTPSEGQIEIAWMQTNDNCIIHVKDNGIGIPEEDLPHVFERFFRVDRDRNRQSGGTGLGLSITKHLIELHNGNVSVESKRNHGSCFTIHLPIKKI
jgi:two-component system phosphate regulon sensor histidine kinase PhoR